jgi:hypothetical protein
MAAVISEAFSDAAGDRPADVAGLAAIVGRFDADAWHDEG